MNSHAAGTSNGGSGDAAAGGAARRNTRMPKCEISRRIYPVCFPYWQFSSFVQAKAWDGAIICAGVSGSVLIWPPLGLEMLLAYALFWR